VLSSSRTGVHSPERSTPVATVLTSSSDGYCCARVDPPIAITAHTATMASVPVAPVAQPFRAARQSKPILDPKLQEARIAGGENLTERRAAQREVRREERRGLARLQPLEPVHRVERLGADLDGLRARQVEDSQQREIERLAADAFDAVAYHRAVRAERRLRERERV